MYTRVYYTSFTSVYVCKFASPEFPFHYSTVRRRDTVISYYYNTACAQCACGIPVDLIYVSFTLFHPSARRRFSADPVLVLHTSLFPSSRAESFRCMVFFFFLLLNVPTLCRETTVACIPISLQGIFGMIR